MLGRRLISAAVLVLCLLAPASAWGGVEEDEEDRPYASFAVQGTNGYRLIVFAAAGEPGEPGEIIVLAMHRSRERAAAYQTKAIVTPTTLYADLGSRGRISLGLAKTGIEKSVRTCAGRAEIERATYWGTFEFHGEQGFSEASASRIPFNPLAYLSLFFCSKDIDVTASGSGDPGPGALLRGSTKLPKRSSLSLEAVKSRPGGRALIRTSLRERRDGIAIIRGVGMFPAAPSLDYDRGLSTATLAPPAPFSGSARFRRDSEGAGRWSGDLRVDLPGRANVSLTRPALRPRLRRGSYSVSDFSFERPALLRPLSLLQAP